MGKFLIVCLLGVAACGRPSTSSLSASQVAAIGPPVGKLCSATDPNFDEFRYKEHIAHCRRNVPQALRDAVAARYGVPRSDYSLYEFDHFIPLNAGGADDIDNLWPEPLADAHEKDKLELEIFNGLSAGTLTQAEAVAEVKAWHPPAQ